MKFLKNNFKLIIGFIVGVILAGGIVYAATSANQVNYTTSKNAEVSTVEQALNDLYSKSYKTPQQVATLTTKGATYTMQNDGYITGTLLGEGSSSYATVRFQNDNNKLVAFSESGDANIYTREVSIYAPKGTIIVTRSEYGTYNLTVYEWK